MQSVVLKILSNSMNTSVSNEKSISGIRSVSNDKSVSGIQSVSVTNITNAGVVERVHQIA